MVLPLEVSHLPKDAVLLRAETDERDGVLQEVMSTIKKDGLVNMRQYAFRSSSDGRAMIEVLFDGSQRAEVEKIVAVSFPSI